ncbi:MBL fold metallo-hydrolase [Candidatus Dojkabacteria bacterium]|nr:MBL fold metallo-hydrolase [Candidatus Dojkabacteria bacterium]
MKLTVLVDNNTLIDRYLLGEPAVSFYIEEKGYKCLFDVGYSGIFIKNACTLDIDLLDLDAIVLSHGHLDHTWGLDPLLKLYNEAKIEKRFSKKPKLYAHPDVFKTKKIPEFGEIGSSISQKKIGIHVELELSQKPVWLTESIVYLGEIPRRNDFENKKPIGKIETDEGSKDDFLLDDTAIAYKSEKGMVVITGCSHAGICNIVEYAKEICEKEKVIDVVGGFHLMDPTENQMKGALSYFEKLNAQELHACHCVDLQSKIELAKVANLKEVGSGLVLTYE